MKKQISIGGFLLAAQIIGSSGALAGPWEDGMAAYNRGDYVPAIRVFRSIFKQRSTAVTMSDRFSGVRPIAAAPLSPPSPQNRLPGPNRCCANAVL